MKKEYIKISQVISAYVLLLLGFALCVAGFCVPPVGEVHSSVCGVFGECLIYAGSVFGLSIYINGKFSTMGEELLKQLELQKEKEENNEENN